MADDAVNVERSRYPADELARLGVRVADASEITVRGDSMAPTLRDGDRILVDRGQSVPGRGAAIWVIRVDELLMVKRLTSDGRRWRIVSDNPDWPELVRDKGEVTVIGRVVRLNGVPTTVVGVMPRGFSFPQNQDLWVPLVPTAEVRRRDRRTTWFVLGRLSRTDFDAFYEQSKHAAEIARKAYDSTERAESSEYWRQLLGNKFPKCEDNGGGSKKGGWETPSQRSDPGTGRFA